MEKAFEEGGDPVLSQDFDWDSIFAKEQPEVVEFSGAECGKECMSPEEVEQALDVMDRLLKWVWQSGSRNADGIKIRSILLCWICLKALRNYSLTELAGYFALHKQSLGRWVDDFKVCFPRVRIPHMRTQVGTVRRVLGWRLQPGSQAKQRLSKILNIIRDHPIREWPQEQVEDFRMDLEPVAKSLWPNKF